MPDRLFLVAARTLAEQVSDMRLASGALYPPVDALRPVTRAIARAVALEARAAGVAGLDDGADLDGAVDAAMWWPDYVPYGPAEDRRSSGTSERPSSNARRFRRWSRSDFLGSAAVAARGCSA
jgi:hypothetical protein